GLMRRCQNYNSPNTSTRSSIRCGRRNGLPHLRPGLFALGALLAALKTLFHLDLFAILSLLLFLTLFQRLRTSSCHGVSLFKFANARMRLRPTRIANNLNSIANLLRLLAKLTAIG